ncbi:MAG TPA: GspH/FimT family pseudopilin [Rhodocyclaceae bacterium]
MRPSAISRPTGDRGFTIVELVFVLVIAGILAALAAPSFSQFIDAQRAKNAATDIYVALTRARSEALRLNQNVTLAPVSGNWASGWQITDSAANVLDAHPALRNLTVTGPTNVVYRSSGRLTSGADALFTITGSFASSTQYLCLDLSGRPSITTSSSC